MEPLTGVCFRLLESAPKHSVLLETLHAGNRPPAGAGRVLGCGSAVAGYKGPTMRRQNRSPEWRATHPIRPAPAGQRCGARASERECADFRGLAETEGSGGQGGSGPALSAQKESALGRRDMLGLMGGVSCAVGLAAACRSSGGAKRKASQGAAKPAETQPSQEPAPRGGSVLSPEAEQIISHFANGVVPSTDTPGAVEAAVPAYVASLIDDVLEEAEQTAVVDALQALSREAQSQMGSAFSALSDAQRTEFLERARSSAIASTGTPATKLLLTKLHGWIVEGYARSRDGATRTLRYEAVPGAYAGCVSLESLGGRAWATN